MGWKKQKGGYQFTGPLHDLMQFIGQQLDQVPERMLAAHDAGQPLGIIAQCLGDRALEAWRTPVHENPKAPRLREVLALAKNVGGAKDLEPRLVRLTPPYDLERALDVLDCLARNLDEAERDAWWYGEDGCWQHVKQYFSIP